MLSGRVVKCSNTSTKNTVASGKYISKVLTAYTDDPEGARQHLAGYVEQGSKEPRDWVPYPRFASQGQSSNRSKGPERAAGPKKQLETVLRPESVVGKTQSDVNAAALRAPSKIESATAEGPTDDCASLEGTALEIDFEIIEAPTNGQPSIEADNEGPLLTPPPTIDSRSHGQLSTSDRAVRNRLAKRRFHRGRRSNVARTPTRLDSGAHADGHMVSLKVKKQGEEEADAGDSMVGLEFTGGNAESLGGGEPMDLDKDDSVDEVMIGSDIDGVMEVDGDAPDADGDSGSINGDTMQVEEASPQSAARGTSKPQFGDRKVLHGRISREKAAIPLRQTPRSAVSGPVTASAQPSQQQAALIPASVTGNTDASLLQGVTQNPISTNSAADLREARLGKRAEARVAADTVTESDSIPPPTSIPQSTSSSGRAMPEDGDTSDTTQPTTTPTSTLPSSTSSSTPASPLLRDTTSTTEGSPKPVSGQAGATTPENKNRKRGCDDSDEDDQERRQGPGAPKEASQPSPEQSSKRLRERRPNAAEDDTEIIPLNDMADQGPTVAEIQQQEMNAIFDNIPEDDDTDLDWTSDEDEPVDVRGKGKGKGKEKEKGKEEGGKGKGKGRGKEEGAKG